MKIEQIGEFFLGRLEDTALTQKDRERLAAMANEETEEELMELAAQAEALAAPVVLFGVCGVGKTNEELACVNGIEVTSGLVAEKLSGKNRCFPYVASCGTALEEWSLAYRDDYLTEFWADEIKKLYVQKMGGTFFAHLKESYRTTGHLTALNPGSLKDWPLPGQRELFDILGGADFVLAQTGVRYTESYLMLPSKSISGIAFESDVFYENCQYCPLTDCPNRRAARIEG